MEVIKRSGKKEPVNFGKISARIKNLCSDEERKYVNTDLVAQKTIIQLRTGITTVELDHLSSRICASLATTHYKYSELGGRIAVSNLHKECVTMMGELSLFATIKNLYLYTDIISDLTFQIIEQNKDILEKTIDYDRDFRFDFFGFKTLERAYLLKVNGKIVECPQHMWMRVAVGIHKDDIDAAIETYHLMSQGYFTHASPTLFNSGTKKEQDSSCFLLGTEDSLDGIYKTIWDSAKISKWAGGIGIHVSNIRAKDSIIKGTNGQSSGLIPMLKVYNDTARFINQGGRRNGSIAIYLEPWHADVFDFLEIRKNTGSETERARDLFTALWIPDLFMERVIKNEKWSLMSPDECPGLTDTYGEEFEKLYCQYEQEGNFRKQVDAQEIWYKMMDSQIETGMPYMLSKDHANRKSNQKNIGTIKSSNLCAEIIEYSDSQEYAVCNLASIALPRYIENGKYNFQKLYEVVKVVTRNLNKVIDINYYPCEETRRSNSRHRPIGIGVQGLADVYLKLGYPFESDEAEQLNREMFETIYFAAVEASMDLAKVDGPYETFEGSPFSQGIFQFDMWNVKPTDRWDWNTLRQNVKQYGTRNSLLTALMPTASTSQILGNNECFEPYTSNVYTRKTLAGEFTVVNKYLIDDLYNLGLWNSAMKDKMVFHNGSVQEIEEIPDEIKAKYKTVWEIKQKSIINQAADRGAYVDQSQSMNLHMAEPDYNRQSSAYIYAWKRGLKTLLYYFRSKPAANAKKFTVGVQKKDSNEVKTGEACPYVPGQAPDDCLMCGA